MTPRLAAPLLLIVLAAPSTALVPGHDDAGSGRDAGERVTSYRGFVDLRGDEIPVAFDRVHRGVLDVGDAGDSYTFPGTAGDVVDLAVRGDVTATLVDPAGRYARSVDVNGRGDVAMLSETGTWTLTMRRAPLSQHVGDGILTIADPPPAHVAQYTFEVRPRSPTTTTQLRCHGGTWCEFDLPYTNATYVAAELLVDHLDVLGTWLVYANLLADDWNGPFGVYMIESGGDSELRVGETPSIPLPDARWLTREHSAIAGWSSPALFDRFDAPRDGWLRWRVIVLADPMTSVTFRFSTDGSATPRVRVGDDLVAWTTSDLEGSDAIVTPVLVQAGPQRTTRELGEGFEGLFGSLDPSIDRTPTSGRMLGPDGAPREMPTAGTDWLFDLAPGRWDLELDGVDRASGLGAGNVFLIGAAFG